MDKYNLSESALQEIGKIIKLNLDREDPVFNYHSEVLGDMIHFRFDLENNFVNGDVNNGGHFNAYISQGFMNIICGQTGNSTLITS